MKAIVCTKFGEPATLELREVEGRSPGRGEVRISVRAAGVNFADLLMVGGKYQVKPDLPFIPGLEVAGEIVECGEDVGEMRVGDRVLHWARHGGGFAEEIVADAAKVVRLADEMDFATAAGFHIGHGTAYFALTRRAALRPGETLLVNGAGGGVGLAAVEVGKALGARVIACASTPEKLAAAAERGADLLIDYTAESVRDRAKAFTDGAGVDVVFDPVGGQAFGQALRAIGWHGRMLLIGFACGTVQQIPANIVLVKNVSVIGVVWGAESERDPAFAVEVMGELMEFCRSGAIGPTKCVSHPLERAADVFAAMAERRNVGKAVLVP